MKNELNLKHPLSAHPAADIFPMMSEEEISEIAADIEANGLRERIAVHDGLILDGRNRYAALNRLGWHEDEACYIPMFRIEDGELVGAVSGNSYGEPEQGLLNFVASRNLHRRHLSDSQRAMVAASIADMRKGHRSDKDEDPSPEPSANLREVEDGESAPESVAPGKAPVSVDAAAKAMKVSPRSVSSAKAVLRGGVKELRELVEGGHLAVSVAERIAALGKNDQLDFLMRCGTIKDSPQAVGKRAAKNIGAYLSSLESEEEKNERLFGKPSEPEPQEASEAEREGLKPAIDAVAKAKADAKAEEDAPLTEEGRAILVEARENLEQARASLVPGLKYFNRTCIAFQNSPFDQLNEKAGDALETHRALSSTLREMLEECDDRLAAPEPPAQKKKPESKAKAPAKAKAARKKKVDPYSQEAWEAKRKEEAEALRERFEQSFGARSAARGFRDEDRLSELAAAIRELDKSVCLSDSVRARCAWLDREAIKLSFNDFDWTGCSVNEAWLDAVGSVSAKLLKEGGKHLWGMERRDGPSRSAFATALTLNFLGPKGSPSVERIIKHGLAVNMDSVLALVTIDECQWHWLDDSESDGGVGMGFGFHAPVPAGAWDASPFISPTGYRFEHSRRSEMGKGVLNAAAAIYADLVGLHLKETGKNRKKPKPFPIPEKRYALGDLPDGTQEIIDAPAPDSAPAPAATSAKKKGAGK